MHRILALLLLFGVGLQAAPRSKPNVVLVMVDDLRWDELSCAGHPVVRTPNIDRLATEGMMFRNAFVSTPLCSPSRASTLTGLYAHDHGITDNTDRSPASHRLVTFPRRLHDAGYRTAFVGKWHMGNDDTPRPGFDVWAGLQGQGESNDPILNENGERVQTRGYVTDILTDRAVRFIRKQGDDGNFLLYLAHKAVHPNTVQNADGSLSDPSASNFIPAERHKKLYGGVPVPRRPNAFKPPTGKPALLRSFDNVPPLGPETGTSDESIRDRQRMLAAIDEGLGEILRALEETGHLKDTMVVFTSDEGYFYGEHGLSVERRLAYEESIRIPLLIRYPGLVEAGSRREQMVLNLDLAPTFLELAGVRPPSNWPGRSLVPLLKENPRNWRESFLIEYFSDRVFPRMSNMGYQAVRTKDHKYIHYLELPGADELYDLKDDPYEMRNLVAEPGAQKTLVQMKQELERLLKDGGGRP